MLCIVVFLAPLIVSVVGILLHDPYVDKYYQLDENITEGKQHSDLGGSPKVQNTSIRYKVIRHPLWHFISK